MKKFLGKNFLLTNETAEILYHEYAKKLPIIDYHCHVNPADIAEDKIYPNITQLWLGGDHYKWRAMRSCGIIEKYITGDASDYEKFNAYTSVMPNLIGNPLYHWSHLEMKRYFGYSGIINKSSCDDLWYLCNDKLSEADMSVKNLIKKSNVEVICTTDDPCDTLENHKNIAKDEKFETKVFPAWRPDKYINADNPDFLNNIAKLSAVSQTDICDIKSLKDSFIKRLDYFASMGCKAADHGLDRFIPYNAPKSFYETECIFKKILNKENTEKEEIEKLKTDLLCFFASEYKKRSWVMQFHFGVLRNVNTKAMSDIGVDSGFDIIGDEKNIYKLAALLNEMDRGEGLPKTILYSINPNDNAALGALTGAFQLNSSDCYPRVMQGSAWWFNDNKQGMTEQIKSLANLSAIGYFTGMLTDSRSFLSYTRHEYFRRIFCNIIGKWAEDGECTDDINTLSKLVENVCYYNAKKIFNFN